MEQESRIQSILAVDIGAVKTQAVLVARVEGSFRFIGRGEAPTTIELPWENVVRGVDHAVEQLAAVTQHPFTDDHGILITPERADGRGVDVCVVTVSGAAPLKLVLIGLSADLSVASLQRAACTTYTQVIDVLALAGSSQDGNIPQRLSEEDSVRRIYRARPDVICMAGGTDGGAEGPVLNLVDSVVLAASLLADVHRPNLLYAGNASLRQKVTEIVGPEARLAVADNVRPAPQVESLGPAQMELEEIYQATQIADLPGFTDLKPWSPFPALPTSRAMAHVAQHLSLDTKDRRKGVLMVDAGGASTTLVLARDGVPCIHVRSDLGTALGTRQVIKERGVENIARWLPFEAKPGQIEALSICKGLYPASVSQDTNDLLIEQAIAREALRLALAGARAGWPSEMLGPSPSFLPYVDPIIGGGSILGRAPRPGQAALILLDSLEPVGVTTLVLDTLGLLPALGACAVASPLAAVQALNSGGLTTLGTVVTPVGRARLGETILGVRIKYESGGDLEVDVSAGSLEVLPLPLGQKAILELVPRRRHIDVGRGGPGRGGKPIEVQGGLVGLIIDARGRPLTLPADPVRRRERVQQWLWDMGA